MKQLLYIKLCISIALICPIDSKSQIINPAYITSYDSENNFYVFNQSIYQTNSSTFRSNALNTPSGLNLQLLRTKSDAVGYVHRKYLQTYNGVPILGTNFTTHDNVSTNTFNANGRLISGISVNTTPGISASSAIQTAMNIDGGSLYTWQLADSVRQSTADLDNVQPNFYPSPKLFIYKDEQAGAYKLIYKVRLYCESPLTTHDYFIDAINNTLVKKYTLSAANCHKPELPKETKKLCKENLGVLDDNAACNDPCQTGSANVKFYGGQYIYTDKFSYIGLCRYRPKNTCTGTYLYVRKANGTDYRNVGNAWGTNDRSATTALFALQNAHDYFRFTLNRNSFDDNFSQINLKTEVSALSGQAKWTGSDIQIGTVGGGYSDEVLTLDAIAHELTHGITQNEAALYYEAESGALNESFSDIFGVMAEFYGKNTYNTGWSADYLVGEEILSGGKRDMANPKSKGDPDTYHGQYWRNTGDVSLANDYGGVHFNSGVPNRWFNLLAEGGSGTNDNNHSYCVKAIGRDKATKIAYQTLCHNLTNQSATFADARFASILSATQLYGAASDEVAQVTAAWYAVGVGSPFTGQVNYSNQTVNSQTDIHYNSKVSLQNVTANAPSLYVTSNTEIELINDVNLNAGSWVELYIAPVGCSGAARLINPNGNGSGRGQTANATTQSNSARSAVPVILNENDSRDNTYIQPNPSNGVFTLLLNENRETPQSVTVLDYQGKVVKEFSTINRHELDVNISELNSGIYFVKISYNDTILTKKVIKN